MSAAHSSSSWVPQADAPGSRASPLDTEGEERCMYAQEQDSQESRVLTDPPEAVSNEGRDNVDANLVVRVHDQLVSAQSGITYTCLDTVGTGTFGQVFRCHNGGSGGGARDTDEGGRCVAVKVIKNKPAYHSQGEVEIALLLLLKKRKAKMGGSGMDHLVAMEESFVFAGHICIVFELLSISMLDVLIEQQFRGLPLTLVQTFTRQLVDALVSLEGANIIHCDLKPENILLQHSHEGLPQSSDLKIIDFGSACFEGKTVYSYIQSRFYRSPEVLLGVPYSGAIDMWSLACVCVEMYIGLPLFPGVSQHNQLSRITEMMGTPPDLFLEGKSGRKYFTTKAHPNDSPNANNPDNTTGGTVRYRIKTPEEYAAETGTEIPVLKRYLRYSRLDEVIMKCPLANKAKLTPEKKREEMVRRACFLDFLGGLFQVDPFQRWTAKQASTHPFVTGATFDRPHVPPRDKQVNERKLAFILAMQKRGYSGKNLTSICRLKAPASTTAPPPPAAVAAAPVAAATESEKPEADGPKLQRGQSVMPMRCPATATATANASGRPVPASQKQQQQQQQQQPSVAPPPELVEAQQGASGHSAYSAASPQGVYLQQNCAQLHDRHHLHQYQQQPLSLPLPPTTTTTTTTTAAAAAVTVTPPNASTAAMAYSPASSYSSGYGSYHPQQQGAGHNLHNMQAQGQMQGQGQALANDFAQAMLRPEVNGQRQQHTSIQQYGSYGYGPVQHPSMMQDHQTHATGAAAGAGAEATAHIPTVTSQQQAGGAYAYTSSSTAQTSAAPSVTTTGSYGGYRATGSQLWAGAMSLLSSGNSSSSSAGADGDQKRAALSVPVSPSSTKSSQPTALAHTDRSTKHKPALADVGSTANTAAAAATATSSKGTDDDADATPFFMEGEEEGEG
eukprot:GSChrysophyteH2.ASY1.ANO1.1377.1 assembled CDS